MTIWIGGNSSLVKAQERRTVSKLYSQGSDTDGALMTTCTRGPFWRNATSFTGPVPITLTTHPEEGRVRNWFHSAKEETEPRVRSQTRGQTVAAGPAAGEENRQGRGTVLYIWKSAICPENVNQWKDRKWEPAGWGTGHTDRLSRGPVSSCPASSPSWPWPWPAFLASLVLPPP